MTSTYWQEYKSLRLLSPLTIFSHSDMQPLDDLETLQYQQQRASCHAHVNQDHDPESR